MSPDFFSPKKNLTLGGHWSKIRAKNRPKGLFFGQFLTPFLSVFVSKNSFKAKNPSLFAKIRPKGGCAIPARAVFSGFLPKKAKKHEKTGLSLYGPVPTSVSPTGSGGRCPKGKAKGNLASLDFLWHEFLTSGLLVSCVRKDTHETRRPLVKNSCHRKV